MKAKVHIFLFLTMLIYAANYLIIKEITPSVIGASATVFLRVVAGLLFFGLLALTVYREKVLLKDKVMLAVCAVFGIAINQLFFVNGISLTQPINASLIMITVPIMVMLLAYFVLNEPITKLKLLGVFIGGFGAFTLITGFQKIDFNAAGFRGDVFILINAISFAIYLVLVKRLLHKYNPFTIAYYLFLYGIFMVFPFALSELNELDFAAFETKHYTALAYVLVMTTCAAYILYISALKLAKPTLVSSYIYLQPVLTTILSLFFAKDALTHTKIIGGLLIFIGVALVNFSQGKQPNEALKQET